MFLVRAAVQPRASWRDVGQDGFDINIVLCFGYKKVSILVKCVQRHERGEHNTADSGTKTVTAPVPRKQLKTLKVEWRDGRPPPRVECVASTA